MLTFAITFVRHRRYYNISHFDISQKPAGQVGRSLGHVTPLGIQNPTLY
jgi:hypothetical protein